MSKRVLVTGGCGFIGGNLVKELRSRGHDVWLCDNRWSADKHYYHCDVGEYRQLETVIKKLMPDYVYHLAAEYGRWNGEAHYENLWRTNVVGTKHLLRIQEEMVQEDEAFRMVFFSSAEVYGDYSEVMEESVMDRVPIKQMNDYAMSKWVGEMQVLISAAMFNTETVRVRPVMCYGPGDHYHPYRGVIPTLIRKALLDEPYRVHRGHSRIFDYVEDTCRTFANIIDNFIPGAVYNVGGREEWEVSIKDVSDTILGILGKDDSMVEYLDAEPFTTVTKRMSFDRARLDLSHNPTVGLMEGLRRTIKWVEENDL